MLGLPVLAVDWPKRLPGTAGQLTGEIVKKVITAVASESFKALTFCLNEMKDFIKHQLRTCDDFTERIKTYRELLQGANAGVLVLFAQSYQDTREFIKSNGFEGAKQRYQDAHDALASWSSSLSGGARTDAEAFAELALEQLSWVLARTEATFNDFVNRNKEKFFGPVGPDIREALTGEKEWEERVRGFKRRGVETILREFRDDAKTCFTVDLDGIIGKNIDELRLRMDILNNNEQRELITLYEGYCKEMRKGIEETLEELVKAIEESQRLWSDAELDEAFKRVILGQAIPTA